MLLPACVCSDVALQLCRRAVRNPQHVSSDRLVDHCMGKWEYGTQ